VIPYPGLEVGRYGTVCHIGTSFAGSKPYRHFSPEKYHVRVSQGQYRSQYVPDYLMTSAIALSRGQRDFHNSECTRHRLSDTLRPNLLGELRSQRSPGPIAGFAEGTPGQKRDRKKRKGKGGRKETGREGRFHTGISFFPLLSLIVPENNANGQST